MTHGIIFIGMPASGKTTLAQQLSRQLGRSYIDTDRVIESYAGKTLQNIVDEDGVQTLRSLEEHCLSTLQIDKALVATGGSAVYSDKAMRSLKKQGVCIYLELSFDTIAKRLNNADQRGLVRRADQSLQDLFQERIPLYEAYADRTVNCDSENVTQLCEKLAVLINEIGQTE